MFIYLLAGVAIGIFINDWLGRTLLAGLMGVFDCVSLAFRHWLRPSDRLLTIAMKDEGVPEREVNELTDAMRKMDADIVDASGLHGWRLYGWQFIWSWITTLVPTIVTGLIRDFAYWR